MAEGARILVVAGDALLGKALAMYLLEAGFVVTRADGAGEAQRLAAARRPDVAVVDHLSNADVHAVMAVLSAHEVPAVLLTHDPRVANDLNVAACLEKPFEPRRLVAAVVDACGGGGA